MYTVKLSYTELNEVNNIELTREYNDNSDVIRYSIFVRKDETNKVSLTKSLFSDNELIDTQDLFYDFSCLIDVQKFIKEVNKIFLDVENNINEKKTFDLFYLILNDLICK